MNTRIHEAGRSIHSILVLMLAGGVLASCLLVSGNAAADMVLSDVIVDLQAPQEMRYDVEVWNSGDEPLYVEVVAAEVLEPATDESVRRELTDPRQAGLLVSPKRLVVSPDERKRVRLVARKVPTDQDLVYRVSFVPKENKTRTTKEMAFKVLVGYEVLVLIRPAGARPNLIVTRDASQLHVENTGASSILIRKLDYCPEGDSSLGLLGDESKSECEELPGNRLYAGEVWDVELPGTGPIRVFESYRSENRVREY
jgi:P pilus assembly chaperone PapD